MEMPTFERSIVIRAAREALFDLTQDYDRRLAWDPFLSEARLVGGARAAGLGARAWCAAYWFLGMETEYISFRRPDVVAVRMTRGPALLENFAGSWRFADLGGMQTRVTFRYHLKARPPALDRLLTIVFERDVELRLRGLRRYAERVGV
jgi:ribosome-associated toxin RatA of RatAB toxin-antitoxin module